MKLRTQLIVAFFLLAIVPLTGLVAFSYFSSVRTLRSAVREEANRMADQIERNMIDARAELTRGWTGVQQMFPPGFDGDQEVREAIETAMEQLGPLAGLVRRWQLHEPMAPEVDEAPAHERDGGDIVVVPRAPRVFYVEPGDPDASDSTDSVDSPGRGGTRRFELRRAPSPAARLDRDLKRYERQAERAQARLERQIEAAEAEAAAQENLGEELAAERAVARAEKLEADLEELEERGMRLDLLGRDIAELFAGRGNVEADIDVELFLRRVLERTRRAQGEVPFAVDPEGQVFATSDEDRNTVLALVGGDGRALYDAGEGVREVGNWVIVAQPDRDSDLHFGIARPIDESLADIRASSARNLVLGLGLIGLALLGILPLSSRLTRRLTALSAEADRLASGDLEARVPVRGRDELAQLARSFNRMAGELSSNQEQLLEQERRSREQEFDRRLLEAENSRRGDELEQARRFQLSLLPTELPRVEDLDVAVSMKTATEVGGDYYDFWQEGDELTVVIGDATGHGVRAGTMVTAIKTLFSASRARSGLREFLVEANAAIRSMKLNRMTMALALLRYRDGKVVLASAGMPPLLVYRASAGHVEEVECPALPLGAMDEPGYGEVSVELHEGDVAMLLSDGLAELDDGDGGPIGYAPVMQRFAELGELRPEEIVSELERFVGAHVEERPDDDVTFVVMARRAERLQDLELQNPT